VELRVVEHSERLTHVALEGSLDINGVNAVADAFYFNLTSRKRPGIVDMSGVTFIGSLGVGMLVRVAQSLRRQGFRMVLLNPVSTVEGTLRLSSIDKVIPIASSVKEAERKALYRGSRPAE